MKQTIKRFLAVAAFLLMIVPAYAQVTTASFAGTVVDENGEPLIGAAVVAVHAPSGTQYYAVTNENGRYAIQGMRTGGPYEVTYSLIGCQTIVVPDIILSLAETYQQDVVLKTATELLNEAIVVASASSKLVTERTGAATNINNAQIVNLPSVSRAITDVTRLSPYGGNGMSFAGADGRTANFTVDGANFNNNFGLSDKLPGGGSPISIDAIEELQVVISPYDVRQTNFIGGGVNAITKSGTNTFKGSAYVYHKNENLQGDTVDGEQISNARAKNRTTTYGFTAGGPIIKNKLFFFVNGEYSKIPTIVNRWRGSSNGVANPDDFISRTRLTDLQRVSEYVKSKYGYDTGSWTDFPANENNMKILARIDWNISDKHKLALRYNYTKNNVWNNPNGSSMDGGTRMSGARISQYSMSFANSMYSMQNLVSTWSLDLNSRLSDNVSNQFLATFSKLDDVRGTNSEEFPFIDILDDTQTNNYMALGYELFTWNNAVHNTIANVKDDVTWYKGSHKVTAGINYEYQMADNQYMRNGTGYYRYKSVEDFLSGAIPQVVCLTYGYDGEQYPAARVQFHKAGVYAQDDWNVTDRFKLTYGLRIDGLFFDNSDLMTNNKILALDYFPKVYNYELTHIDTGKWPTAKVTFSPRVGFSWDVFGDKSFKVRGGTGLFSGRLPLVFFTNMPTNGGLVQYQAQIGTSTRYANLPDAVKGRYASVNDILAQFAGGLATENGKANIAALYNKLVGMGFPSTVSPADGTKPSAVNGVDPNFKMPQIWKSSLALDLNLPTPFPWTMTAEGIFNKTVNGTLIKNWNTKDNASWSRFTGPDNRHIYPSKANQSWTNIPAYVLTNTDKGYGWIFNFNTNIEPVRNLKLMFSYTHTEQKELTGMPGNNAESVFTGLYTVEGPNFTVLQNSRFAAPDRLMASVSYKTPFRLPTLISVFYEGYIPGGYSFTYANDFNGDGINTDLIYIPKDGNDILFTTEQDKKYVMDFIAQDQYLSSHMGQYAEAYSAFAPMVHKFDLRVTQDLRIRLGGTTQTLQLSADLMNFTNLMNDTWGVSKVLDDSCENGQIMVFDTVNANGQPIFKSNVAPDKNGVAPHTWRLSQSRGQCWYLQLGVKYMFN